VIALLTFSLSGCDEAKNTKPTSTAPAIGRACSVEHQERVSDDGVVLVCNAEKRWQRKVFEGGSR
jgi:hypothetical protein